MGKIARTKEVGMDDVKKLINDCGKYKKNFLKCLPLTSSLKFRHHLGAGTDVLSGTTQIDR